MSSILLVQADPVALGYFNDLIGSSPTLAVSAAVSTLAEARAAIAHRVPDLIVADLRLPDGPFVSLLEELGPSRSHVLVLATTPRDPYLLHALRHGADSYVELGEPRAALLAAMHAALAGESTMAPSIAHKAIGHFAVSAASLGEGEELLLQWLAAGSRPAEIAADLGISARQVGVSVRAIYRKMQARWREPR
ncbi:MAG: LuxR C-terminal-related transcriptional regulator [Burkholderiales bacterium]